MIVYCRAVLRPEGIACTLPAGHDRYTSEDGKWSTDHVNKVGRWSDGRPSREGIPEWGFDNPVGRKLEDEGLAAATDAPQPLRCSHSSTGPHAMPSADWCDGPGPSPTSPPEVPSWAPAREPDCIHSDGHQPASACDVCQHGPELASWRAYWDAHPERIPKGMS